MGLFANLPVGLAPGLGLNGYVSHAHIRYLIYFFPNQKLSVRICCRRFPRKWHHHLSWGSSRRIPRGVSRTLFLTLLVWRISLFLSFLRWVFFILSLLGLRQWLVRIMPQSLVLAVGAGIGLFIASVRIALPFGSGMLTVIYVNRFIGLCKSPLLINLNI